MFHRKRHHHHQRSGPAAGSNSRSDLETNRLPSDPSAMSRALLDYSGQQQAGGQADLAPPAIPPRRSTSPVCPRTVELAASVLSDGALGVPDHSPSPIRRQPGNCPLPPRSQAASPESGMSSSPSSSSLTGLFRRKRSPMELVASQSFTAKSSTPSPSKPLPPPRPHRLVASNSTDEPKGRSPSPLPSANMLAAMVMGAIYSTGLDVSQGEEQQDSEQQSSQRRANAHNLPTLTLNAGKPSRSEPVSPSRLHDPRQPVPLSQSLSSLSLPLLWSNFAVHVVEREGASWL